MNKSMNGKIKYIENFEFEISFSIFDSYFYGKPRDLEQKENYSEKLFVPYSINANSILVYNNTDLLIEYYEDVITIAQKHNQFPDKMYFRLHPYILNKDTNEVLALFSWYSTFEECKYLFSKLRSQKEGNVFYDVDQSWELIIDRFDDTFFVLEQDPDENEIYCNINLNRKKVLKEIDLTEKRTEEIIGKLTKHFKRDYWSKY